MRFSFGLRLRYPVSASSREGGECGKNQPSLIEKKVTIGGAIPLVTR